MWYLGLKCFYNDKKIIEKLYPSSDARIYPPWTYCPLHPPPVQNTYYLIPLGFLQWVTDTVYVYNNMTCTMHSIMVESTCK